MKTPLQFYFKLHKFGSHSLANDVPEHHILPILGLTADVGKAKKIERLRLSFTLAFAIVGRKPPKFNQPCLVLMEFQAKPHKTFTKVSQEPFGILPVLEAKHEVIAEPDDDHIATGMSGPPLVRPQIKHIVQIDVREQRADTSPLGYTFLATRHNTLLKHACVEPLLNVSLDALVRNPVLNELHQPLVVDGIKGNYDTLPTSKTFPQK